MENNEGFMVMMSFVVSIAKYGPPRHEFYFSMLFYRTENDF